MVDPGRTLGEVAAVTRTDFYFYFFIFLYSHVNDTTTNTIFGGNSGATGNSGHFK